MKQNEWKLKTQTIGNYCISYHPGYENCCNPWFVHTTYGMLVSKWFTRGQARAAVKGYNRTDFKRDHPAIKRPAIKQFDPEEYDDGTALPLTEKRIIDAGFTDDFYAKYPFVRPRDDKS